MSGDLPEAEPAATAEGQEVGESKTEVRRILKRAAEVEDVCLVDASKEGNVSRFINVSGPEPTVQTPSSLKSAGKRVQLLF